jgi:hypothetical protein
MVLGSGIRDPGPEIRDPRSGIREKPILDPGSRIRIRNTGQRHGPGSGSFSFDSGARSDEVNSNQSFGAKVAKIVAIKSKKEENSCLKSSLFGFSLKPEVL